MSAGIKLGLALVVLGLGARVDAQDDFRTRVAVIPMANHTGDTVNDTICRTVTDTVALVLRLLGTYAVTESYEDPALNDVDTADIAGLGAFAQERRFDEIIFGEAVKPEDAYLSFSLRLYSRSAEDVKFQQVAVADTLFDVFDAADSISIGLISQFSDIHIGFGKIEVRKGAGTGAYQVYLNDNRIRYPETGLAKVLNGTYTLSIRQDRLLGLTEIHRRELAVYEDKTTVVEFDIPTATPEETAYLESLSRKVEAAGEQGQDLEVLLKELAEFQAVAAAIDYDPTLSQRCAQTVTVAGERASAQLEEAIAQADQEYYAKRPRFGEALQTYERLSTLLNDVYEPTVFTESGSALTNPVCVVASPDGSFYVLEAYNTLSIRRVADGQIGMPYTLPDVWYQPSDPAVASGMAVDASGNLCYAHNTSAEILVLTPTLNPGQPVAIPGYTPGGDRPLCLAISADGTFYALAGDEVYVFRAGEDRQAGIEEAIRATEASVGWGETAHCVFDHQGRLLLFDSEAGRILRLDYLGGLISEVRLPQPTPGSWLAADGLGYFYVTFPEGNEIRKYSPDGEYLTTIGRYGIKPGEFSVPQRAVAQKDGTLVVCDSANSRIQVLAPRSAPVLLQRVVQYGDRFAAREQAAQQAVRKMEIVSRDIRPMRTLSQFAGTFLSLGASVGLAVASSVFVGIADTAFQEYRAATTVADVMMYRNQAENAWYTSRGLVVGLSAAAAVGSALFATTLLTTADQATAQERTIRNLQTTDLDTEYTLDTTQWRSLRGAQRVGMLTGVLPPILGGGLGASLLLLRDLVPWYSYSAAGAISSVALLAIPPLWSHLYGGRFHATLLTAGLIADAAAAAAFSLHLSRPPEWSPAGLGGDGTLFGSAPLYDLADGAWAIVQEDAPLLLWIAATSIRLTAGIYDTTHGWLQAKDHNKYRALRKLDAPVSLRVEPIFNGEMAGLSLQLRY